jgi:hypothetical protein
MRVRRSVFFVSILALLLTQYALTPVAQGSDECRRPAIQYIPLFYKGTDPPALLADAKAFIKRHSQDSLITIWPKDPYVSGILEIAGKRIYEVTCPQWGPFDHNTFGMIATQAFLLYERDDGKLTRLNLVPESWVSLPKGGAAKCISKEALRAFARFLKWVGPRNDWQPEEVAFLSAALMLHELPGNLPCVSRLKGQPALGNGRELPKELGSPPQRGNAQKATITLYYPGLLITASFDATFSSGGELASLCYVRLGDEVGLGG